MEAIRPGLIEWAVAERARDGQTESGDRCLAMPTADGALVAVVASANSERPWVSSATLDSRSSRSSATVTPR
jgi:hypothetical protein